jgi:hypothetical protein
MTPAYEQISGLIRKVTDRAYADLCEAEGSDAAELWAVLVIKLGASSFLELDWLDSDRIVALGALAARVPDGFRDPERPLPQGLHELFWEVSGVAVLRKLHDFLGYGELPFKLAFEGFEALAVVTGGLGMVLEAYDPELDRKVAIKLWSENGPAASEALLAEAKTLAKFTHPNVVTIYATGRVHERVYFVMEWIEGADGYGWLQQPRTWREVVEVFLAAGEGLAAAHDVGIQHRDFKPGNMLIGDDGRVVVADFGLADSLGAVVPDDDDEPDDAPEHGKPEFADLRLEASGDRASGDRAPDEPAKVVGTRCYVAPERLRWGPGDARSDQFSFCVALWEGLHGCRPYAGVSRTDVLESIERGAIQSGPRTRHVPHWLSRVVRKGLAEDPDQRFGSMRELLQALRDEPPEYEENDAETDASVVGEGAAGLLNVPAAGGPTWRMLLGATLGAMVLGGLMVGGAMVGGLEYGRALERASRDQPIADMTPNREAYLGEMEPSLAADMPNHEVDMPCALSEYDPRPVDPVVLEVCRLIWTDDYKEAHALWEAEFAKREQPGADSLIVARTFGARADALIKDNDASASYFAMRAHHWAHMAVKTLGDDELRQSEASGLRKKYDTY